MERVKEVAFAALIGLPIWWIGWKLLDRSWSLICSIH